MILPEIFDVFQALLQVTINVLPVVSKLPLFTLFVIFSLYQNIISQA